MLIKNGVQVLVIGAVLGSAYMVCTIYTRHVFKAMIEENYKFDGECLSLQPYHGQILYEYSARLEKTNSKIQENNRTKQITISSIYKCSYRSSTSFAW